MGRGAVREAIEITRAGGCVTARIAGAGARPKLGSPGANRLLDLFEQVEDDESIRMLALTGTGRWFCGGFGDDVDPRLVESLAAISKPTVAIINGDAIDEGLELALAADLRVAIGRARFALTQLARGALPHFGGTQRLPRIAGAANALRMILTGAAIDGAEARRIGLVTYLAGSERELAKVAGALAEAIVSRAPLAARLVKDAVLKGYDMTLEQGVRLEEDLYALLQTTADRGEGVRAFLDKRKPLFRGA
ncbi:MAG TPA: enoyl-CoA hydratase/isomerase family protein [Candidatus Binataceae bacterium]|nr:enoyl-CoA hydratase/isomerase family protein [Candidatus Binataceae bacterium]